MKTIRGDCYISFHVIDDIIFIQLVIPINSRNFQSKFDIFKRNFGFRSGPSNAVTDEIRDIAPVLNAICHKLWCKDQQILSVK